jgi:hypothetical protein
MPGTVISFPPIHMLLKLHVLFVMNSIGMSRDVWRSIDGGLSAFQLHFFTTKASKVVHVHFAQWVCPGVPLIMLDYHPRPD